MLYSIILFLGAMLTLTKGYGLLPWAKRGVEPKEPSNNFMKNTFKVGGFSMLMLASVYGLKAAGIW